MALKPSKLWALVTDSGCGRLIELEASPARIEEIATREAPARHKTSQELTTDASGREYDATGPVSHSKHPRTDAHEEAEEQFAREWVDGLQKAFAQGRFEHLMLVADPRTLGRLREYMDKKLRATVAAEDARGLTKLSLEVLEPELRELAGWGQTVDN